MKRNRRHARRASERYGAILLLYFICVHSPVLYVLLPRYPESTPACSTPISSLPLALASPITHPLPTIKYSITRRAIAAATATAALACAYIFTIPQNFVQIFLSATSTRDDDGVCTRVVVFTPPPLSLSLSVDIDRVLLAARCFTLCFRLGSSLPAKPIPTDSPSLISSNFAMCGTHARCRCLMMRAVIRTADEEPNDVLRDVIRCFLMMMSSWNEGGGGGGVGAAFHRAVHSRRPDACVS